MDWIIGDSDMIENADVVVVGAGPAGSTAAEHAALNGAEVVLLERREEIGLPVKCGEFMPSVSEIRGIFPMADDLESLFDLPNDLISIETGLIRIWSPKQKSFEIPFSGYTTDRDRFDQFLARKAEKAGVRIIRGCSCQSVEGNTVMTDNGPISAKVIIGADGPLSRVARSVGIPKAKDLCPAVTAQTIGDFEDVCEMFFGSIAPGAYAWIIPKKNGANVGLGISPRFAKKSVKEYFWSFVEERGFEVDRVKGKHVPMSGPVKRSVVGNTLVVGDAAGHVMAVNGGGIPIAMICGRIAGKSAAKTALKGASLELYESIWKRQVEKPLRTAVRSKRWADTCWGSPLRLEMAMTFLGKRRMGNMIRCKSVFP
jgi:digeranylgeranylglycerophospholipid reductase